MPIKVTSLPDAQPSGRHVAIGTFDGVHRGHQAVIDDADTVLTFDPHPLEVLHPAALPKFLPVCETTARPPLRSALCGAIWSPNPMAASMRAAFGSCPAEYESRPALASTSRLVWRCPTTRSNRS